MTIPLGLASDHAGLELKRTLLAALEQRGLAVRDLGTHTGDSCDYPDFAHTMARAIAAGEVGQGILVCGTGVGMSIAANRHAAVRAVVCSEPLSARMARQHNDANVLCLGARVIGAGTALDIVDAFLGASFEGGRHAGRVAKIDDGARPSLFEALGGAAGVLRLAHAWHERVLADEVVAHAFSHGFHPQHTERLAAYWGEAWGGPAAYTALGGTESSVVRMHSGHGPHEDMDQRAIACFDQAMADAGVVDARLRKALHDYFAWTTTAVMSGYPRDADDVPADLRLTRWSWDGRA